jgi:hypothetical protein
MRNLLFVSGHTPETQNAFMEVHLARCSSGMRQLSFKKKAALRLAGLDIVLGKTRSLTTSAPGAVWDEQPADCSEHNLPRLGPRFSYISR